MSAPPPVWIASNAAERRRDRSVSEVGTTAEVHDRPIRADTIGGIPFERERAQSFAIISSPDSSSKRFETSSDSRFTPTKEKESKKNSLVNFLTRSSKDRNDLTSLPLSPMGGSSLTRSFSMSDERTQLKKEDPLLAKRAVTYSPTSSQPPSPTFPFYSGSPNSNIIGKRGTTLPPNVPDQATKPSLAPRPMWKSNSSGTTSPPGSRSISPVTVQEPPIKRASAGNADTRERGFARFFVKDKEQKEQGASLPEMGDDENFGAPAVPDDRNSQNSEEALNLYFQDLQRSQSADAICDIVIHEPERTPSFRDSADTESDNNNNQEDNADENGGEEGGKSEAITSPKRVRSMAFNQKNMASLRDNSYRNATELSPRELETLQKMGEEWTFEKERKGTIVDKKKELHSRVEVDRSDWSKRVLDTNKSVFDIKDRVDAIRRSIGFCNNYIPKRGIAEELTKTDLLQLILQYFHDEGLKHSRKALEQASKTKLDSHIAEMPNSRLMSFLRSALKESDRLWDFTIEDRFNSAEEGKDDEDTLHEHLYELGLLAEAENDEEVNIWDEPEEDNIIYEVPKPLLTSKSTTSVSSSRTTTNNNSTASPPPVVRSIRAATLNKLVEKLTPDTLDMEFQKTFLMTYQTFTTTEKLMKKLAQRIQGVSLPSTGGNLLVGTIGRTHSAHAQEMQMKAAMTKQIQLRVVNVMVKWLEGHSSDFNDQQIETFKHFSEKYLKSNPSLYQKLKTTLDKKIESGFSGGERAPCVFTEPPPEPKVDFKQLFSPHFRLLDMEEKEIARQLTLIEFDIFAKIQPPELLNQAWNKPKLRHRSPNVLTMIHRSTLVSEWVATQIVKEEKLKNRAKVFTKFVRIAEALRKLNNFSTLMAVVAGLNNAAVHRLNFMKEEVARSILGTLEMLMQHTSSAKSYAFYREVIANVNPPCIPYIGVYLTDLTFIDEGNNNFIQSPSGKSLLINFHKRKLVYQVVSRIQQLQDKSYNLTEVHQIRSLLECDVLREEILSEKEQWNASLKAEPRGVTDKSQLL